MTCRFGALYSQSRVDASAGPGKVYGTSYPLYRAPSSTPTLVESHTTLMLKWLSGLVSVAIATVEDVVEVEIRIDVSTKLAVDVVLAVMVVDWHIISP
jgi:hypothetical protein